MPQTVVVLSTLNLVIARAMFDDPIHREINRRYLMMVELLPSWDVINTPDLAYGMTRAYWIIKTHLLAANPLMQRLRDRVGVRFEDLQIDGMPLEDYIGFVFGLYTWHQRLVLAALARGETNCVMRILGVFEKTNHPEEYVRNFFERRSLSLDESAKAFEQPPKSPACLLYTSPSPRD